MAASDATYARAKFDPLDSVLAALSNRTAVLHRQASKLKPGDFRVSALPPNVVIQPMPSTGISCFNFDTFSLGGKCFTTLAKALDPCGLCATATEVFIHRSTNDALIHYCAGPQTPLVYSELHRRWNFPNLSVLESSLHRAEMLLANETDDLYKPLRQRDVDRAQAALDTYMASPSFPIVSNDSIQWTACPSAPCVAPEFDRRCFHDTDVRLAVLALRVFANAPDTDDNDIIFAYLLYSSIPNAHTRSELVDPSHYSSSARGLFCRALEHLLTDVDALIEHELDELDEERIKFLIPKFSYVV